MVDHVDSATRSAIMAAVKAEHTKPEMQLRRMLHSVGYRYRLHDAKLPGKPDLVFPSRHKVIFVHGCFWHAHAGCKYANLPKSRVEYWSAKRESNIARDHRTRADLKRDGWDYLVVWQCELKQPGRVLKRVTRFLEG